MREGAGAVWEFRANNKYLVNLADGRTMEGRYHFDAATNPWSIDLEPRQALGGGPTAGIVSVNGEYLKICVSGSAQITRPTAFVSKGEARSILRVMKRLDRPTENDKPVPSLVNLDFEVPPRSEEEVPGWSFSQRAGNLVRAENEAPKQGRWCLHMRVDPPNMEAKARNQQAAWVRSQLILPPQTGEVIVFAWIRTCNEKKQPQLRVAIDGRVQGAPYYRFVPVGLKARALPDEWPDVPLVLRIDNLPKRGFTGVRIGFDVIGQGEVWIDDVTVVSVAGQAPR